MGCCASTGDIVNDRRERQSRVERQNESRKDEKFSLEDERTESSDEGSSRGSIHDSPLGVEVVELVEPPPKGDEGAQWVRSEDTPGLMCEVSEFEARDKLAKGEEEDVLALAKRVSKLDRCLSQDLRQLLRFYRSAGGNSDKAYAATQVYLEWCRKEKPFDISYEDIEEEAITGKLFFHGTDKHGRPVLNLIAGKHFKGKGAAEKTVRLILYLICNAFQRMRDVDDFVLLMDRTDTSMKNMDPDLPKTMIHTFQTFFPGRLGKMIVANPNMMFNTAFKAIRATMEPGLKAKVFVRNGKDWKQQLQNEDISAENLLSSQGGTSDFEFSPDMKFERMNHWTL